jgi:hypothetical protein
MDLLHRAERQEQQEREKKEVIRQAEHMAVKARQLVQKAEAKKLAAMKKIATEMQKVSKQLEKKPPGKQEAMVKISKLQEKVRKRREQLGRAEKFGKLDKSLTGKTDEKIEKLGKTKQEMQKLSDAVKLGDFKKAAKALEELQQKMADGSLSPEKLENLADAMKKMAKGMPQNDELTKAMKKAAEELKSACKGGKCSKQGLSKALEQMKLSQKQMQEIQKQMDEMKACDFARDVLDYEKMCMSCKRPSQICPVCGNPVCAGCGTFDCVCCPVNIGPDGDPCCHCNVSGMCKGGGGGSSPVMQKAPTGGQGGGERPVAEKQPVDFNATKLPPNLGPGKILATQFLRGMPPEDAEAKAEYEDVIKAAKELADEAIRREDIPPESREKIKNYFDDLK